MRAEKGDKCSIDDLSRGELVESMHRESRQSVCERSCSKNRWKLYSDSLW